MPNSLFFASTGRVYVEDTDCGGIVYHANYLKFMERARTDWLTSLGINLIDLQTSGQYFVVVKADVSYIKSARLNDVYVSTLSVKKIKKASIFLEQKVLNKFDTSICYASAKIKLASVTEKHKIIKLPSKIMEIVDEC